MNALKSKTRQRLVICMVALGAGAAGMAIGFVIANSAPEPVTAVASQGGPSREPIEEVPSPVPSAFSPAEDSAAAGETDEINVEETDGFLADFAPPGLDEAKRHELVRQILSAGKGEHWQVLEELGLLVKNSDFEQYLASLVSEDSSGNSNWYSGNWGNISRVVSAWTAFDPRAAASWVVQNAGESHLPVLLGMIVRNWPASENAELGRWLNQLPEGRGRDIAVSRYIARIAFDDPAAAARWYEQIADENQRRAAITPIASGWSRLDPHAAADWLGTLPAGDSRDGAVRAFVMQIMRDAPLTAIEWALTIDNESYRSQAVAGAIGQWSVEDPQAAGEFLRELPPGRERDFSIQRYVFGISRDNPAAAADWATAIGDAALRQQALTRVARVWLNKDEPAARQWLENLDLPEYVKDQISASATVSQ